MIFIHFSIKHTVSSCTFNTSQQSNCIIRMLKPYTPSLHEVVFVHWDVRHSFIIVLVVTVWSPEPLVKPVSEGKILLSVTQMPST